MDQSRNSFDKEQLQQCVQPPERGAGAVARLRSRRGKLEQELHQPVLAGSCTPLTQLSGCSAWEQQQQQGLEGTSLCSWDLWESFGNWCTRGEVPGEQHPTSRGSVTRKQTQIFSPRPPEGVSPRLHTPSWSCAQGRQKWDIHFCTTDLVLLDSQQLNRCPEHRSDSPQCMQSGYSTKRGCW